MKTPALRALSLGGLLVALVIAGRAGETCSACLAPTLQSAPADAPGHTAPAAGHPLRGVIVDILPEKQSLLVRHEEIPGVMRAMTMLLKTDAATLAAAIKGQSVTATLTKREDGWWISDVKPAPTSS